ncbi:hypothetical protein CPB85DRAFT_1250088 [Mucidula mucida]|nr:hypothetical protein CPB85DRAFT_1250088 [Mucidula mucida]
MYTVILKRPVRMVRRLRIEKELDEVCELTVSYSYVRVVQKRGQKKYSARAGDAKFGVAHRKARVVALELERGQHVLEEFSVQDHFQPQNALNQYLVIDETATGLPSPQDAAQKLGIDPKLQSLCIRRASSLILSCNVAPLARLSLWGKGANLFSNQICIAAVTSGASAATALALLASHCYRAPWTTSTPHFDNLKYDADKTAAKVHDGKVRNHVAITSLLKSGSCLQFEDARVFA